MIVHRKQNSNGPNRRKERIYLRKNIQEYAYAF
jgi:hypothetical protein